MRSRSIKLFQGVRGSVPPLLGISTNSRMRSILRATPRWLKQPMTSSASYLTRMEDGRCSSLNLLQPAASSTNPCSNGSNEEPSMPGLKIPNFTTEMPKKKFRKNSKQIIFRQLQVMVPKSQSPIIRSRRLLLN